MIIGLALPLLTLASPTSTFTSYFFLVSIGTLILTEGGHFVLIPTIFAKIYGVDGGMRVYSVGFCFVGFASLFNTILLPNTLDSLHYEGLCFVYGALNLGALTYLTFRYKF